MKIRPVKVLLLIAGLFLAVSVLGGSVIWSILGIADDLAIEGQANIVRPGNHSAVAGWSAYGGDKKGTRFSTAIQINPENVHNLEVAWVHKTGAFDGRENAAGRAAFQATPILVEDKLVFCTQFQDVIALDPATGDEIWRFDPEIPTDGRPANQFTCRGVSHWQDNGQEQAAGTGAACTSRVFVGTVDSRLIALDTGTGLPCSGFGENGQVKIEADIALRWPGEFQITSAPAIVGDTIVTGTAIGDNLRTKAPLGTVYAFDVRTGAPKWSFDPIPRNPADPARASWAGTSADTTGHANVWSTISVDVERQMVFLPTSSPSPDYYGGNRVGDNRYANSVVALDANTGSVKWHFQTVHHDVWDYDVPAQPGLYEVWRDGKAHDVVAQVTKTGLVFVLDRDTGEPFLPIEERAVPQEGVAGEVLSPTQPFPVITPPVVPNRADPDDAFGITLWDKMACSNQIASLRQEGLYTPPSLEGTFAYPFSGGGANWGSTAFDPTRNLLVVNMSNMGSFVKLYERSQDDQSLDAIEDGAEFAPMEGGPYAMRRAELLSPLGLPCTAPPWGVIAGVNLDTGEIVWRQTLGTTEDLAPGGLALKLGTPNFGGPIVTASGLIFIGAAMDDYLRALDVATGRELWKGRLPAGGQATPMTYEYAGRQYLVIAAGGHSRVGTLRGDTVVAFALPMD